MPPAHDPTTPTLRRELGLLDAVGIGFGAIVGARIFVVVSLDFQVVLIGLLCLAAGFVGRGGLSRFA